jgi:hypothetical protein
MRCRFHESEPASFSKLPITFATVQINSVTPELAESRVRHPRRSRLIFREQSKRRALAARLFFFVLRNRQRNLLIFSAYNSSEFNLLEDRERA